MLNAMEQIANVANNVNYTSVVSVAATPVACNGVTTKLLNCLSDNYSEIQLNLIEMRPTKILTTLVDGTADIVIGLYASDRKAWFYNEARRNSLYIEPIMTDSLYAFINSNHPMAQKESVFLQELGQERRAVYQDHVFTWEDDIQSDESISFDRCYAFSDRASIKQAIDAGVVYTIFPHQMALDDIYVDTGRIKAVPLADDETELITYIAWRKNTYMSKAESIVLEYIRKLYVEVEERLKLLSL